MARADPTAAASRPPARAATCRGAPPPPPPSQRSASWAGARAASRPQDGVMVTKGRNAEAWPGGVQRWRRCGS